MMACTLIPGETTRELATNEQGAGDEADEIDQNTDDSDENVLFLSSPSEDNWGNDEA